MKWVKLIGGRFFFIITSAVVTLLCVGVVQIGEHYERRQRFSKFIIPEEPTKPEGQTGRDFSKFIIPEEPTTAPKRALSEAERQAILSTITHRQGYILERKRQICGDRVRFLLCSLMLSLNSSCCEHKHCFY